MGWMEKDTKQVASAAKSDIIKAKPEIKPVTLSLSNLEELEKWQNEYYATNSSVEFTKKQIQIYPSIPAVRIAQLTP